MKPLLLLDVDGVLSPYLMPRRWPGFTEHRFTLTGHEDAGSAPVYLNPRHGPMLLEFAARHDVELVWATLWCHDANRHIAPLIGLPELPVIEFDLNDLRDWKYPQVQQFAGDRPLAWLDDEFGLEELEAEQALGFTLSQDKFVSHRLSLPTLLHHVDPRIGLTEHDLAAVAAWLGDVRAAV